MGESAHKVMNVATWTHGSHPIAPNMPANHTRQIVNKAWGFAHLLRDDGLSQMACTEQITFLLFLKMTHRRTQHPWSRPASITRADSSKGDLGRRFPPRYFGPRGRDYSRSATG